MIKTATFGHSLNVRISESFNRGFDENVTFGCFKEEAVIVFFENVSGDYVYGC